MRNYFLPALLLVAIIILVLRPTTDSLPQVAKRIQGDLNDIQQVFYNAVKDTALKSELLNGDETGNKIEEVESRNILLYYYKKDSLIHWTSGSVLPPANIGAIEQGATFSKLKNGWYMVMCQHDTLAKETWVGLTLVKSQYPFENKFLKNDFEPQFHAPQNIEIAEQKIAGAIPVKDLEGQTLFSLYLSTINKDEDVNALLFATQIILLLILVYYVNFLAAYITRSKGFAFGFISLVITIITIRAITIFYASHLEYSKLDLFDPKFYASSFLTGSLGDLIINSILIVWLTAFWTFYDGGRKPGQTYGKLIPWIAITILFVYTGLVLWVFKTLVLDSTISFEVYNILSLDYYSLLGMICIALLLIPHFVIARNAVYAIRQLKIAPGKLILFSALCALVFSLFAIGSNFYHVILFSAIWSVMFVTIVGLLLSNGDNFLAREVVIYISVYALLSTFLIENLYERKERNQRKFFASRLVTERDYVAEYTFDDIAQRIEADPFVKSFFNNPVISKREVTSRLSSLYLSGYFNKYDVRVYTYDKHGNGLKNRDTVSLEHLYDVVNRDTMEMRKLYYVRDTSQNYSYYAFIPFRDDSTDLGTLVVHLLPKVYYGQNVYPELLLGENVASLADEKRYNYAIYQHDKLIIQHGDYPYAYYWDRDLQFDNSQYKFIDVGDWEHIIYRFNNDMKVIVTDKQEGLFEPVATYSYFFAFYFLVVVIALLVVRLIRQSAEDADIFNSFSFSFRTRINYSMLVMIIISFIIIGFITISFFTRQYDNFYTDRLLRKEKVLHASLEYFIQQNSNKDEVEISDKLSNALGYELVRLSDINDIDINVYDREGNLEVASQPAVYDKGLLSKKMNPDAYFELASQKSSQITEQENVGALKYQTIYAPIRNGAGDAMAYMGIPYFERSRNINDEVSSFLVALMNVYVFLLICAAIVAYFISNSITRPLTIIGEKLRILNLNKRNEPIEWKSRDEIGVLIGEYNKMIKELEQSASKLARSERESAWREMAKQIAHEIKNPLTPMKLSIQYLQRAIDEGKPNISELAKKVTGTLEEQIENLSSIATAFSSFAKMPKAQNEIINLKDLLKGIADLFNREESITITFTCESESPVVFADKNQLVSVFNNLVKNAIQSIPESRTGFIDINVKEDDGWLITSVSDNGAGIPQDNYDKVFVPNFTTKSSGTGLGLAIAKQIIEGAGGKIWFESAENVGTTFFIRLRKNEAV